MKNIEEQLQTYSDFMGLSCAITLEELIESHRSMREQNRKQGQEWSHVLNEAREKGFKEGEQKALTHHYISRETLKQMTLNELMELLQD